MSDDLFTLDLSGMDLKDLIQVVNEMDSKLNNKIIPEILEEGCRGLVETRRCEHLPHLERPLLQDIPDLIIG